MGHAIQRLGFRVSRGWAALLLVAGAIIAAVIFIGPLRPLPAELQVLAVADDQAGSAVVATSQHDTATGRLRFAVPLAVRNVGARSAQPLRLMLSVPAYYRLATSDGPLQGAVTPGLPLVRYDVALDPASVAADSVTRQLAGIDTLWIEPDLPTYYCTSIAGPIPDFVPAPARSPELLSDLRIFYSVRTRRVDERHTGLLAVRIDPEALRVTPTPMPPTFPTTFGDPDIDVPELGQLRQVGTRTAHCGDPEQPMELHTVLWETTSGGRFLVVKTDEVPRKHLYDLDRDSIVELETWDMDGDGRFDARRAARFRIPEFLLPLPSRVPYALRPDTLPPDSIWLAMFHATERGPRRFTEPLPEPPVATRVDTVVAATDTVAPATEEIAPESDVRAPDPLVRLLDVPPADTAGVTRPARAFLWLFNDTAAGPFRFGNRTAVDSAAVRARADSIRAARPRRREPLGVPVPYPRGPGGGG